MVSSALGASALVRQTGGGRAVDPEGMVIDSVVIDNREIYDTDSAAFDGFLFKAVNRLHIVTRRSVIRRELLLHRGDRFSRKLAEEMARNLRKRYSVTDAWVETELLPNHHVLMRVVTVDEWSLLGGFEIQRDDNETNMQFGFDERNLLGYNQRLALE
ncbi:MAG: hypothetical protein D6800_08385, partial [Candidatus Zixiibacteriota bacterium]